MKVKGIKDLIDATRSATHMKKKNNELNLEEGLNTTGYFGFLPNELLVHTFTFVRLEDLKSFRLTCKSWKIAIDETQITINKKKKTKRISPVANVTKRSFVQFKKRSCIFFVLCFSLLMLDLLIVIGMGSYLIQELGRAHNLTPTQCYVISSSMLEQSCMSAYSSSACYYPDWKVTYQVNGRELNATIIGDSGNEDDALSALEEYPKGSTSTCYYDSRDLTSVQWFNENGSMPLLITIVTGVLLIFFIFCTCCSFCIWKAKEKPVIRT